MNEFRLSKNCDHDKLIEYGFEKVGLEYILSVPLYFYNDNPVIEAVFKIVCTENYIGYDVKNVNSDTLYIAYYDISSDTRRDDVLKTVRERFSKVVKDMSDNNIIAKEQEVEED